MEGRLQRRTALVTGAARGIGEAIARRFAEEGADLVICDIDEALLEKTAKYLSKSGRKIVAHCADVSNAESVHEMAQHAFREYDFIDILVNNAGIRLKPSLFVDCSMSDFDRVMKVNVYGVFHVTQTFLRPMIDRKSGKIINIASTFGKWGSKYVSGYNASKHAVVGLTRCIALEVASHGINVNAICPGPVDTEIMAGAYKDYARLMEVSEKEYRRDFLSRVPIGRMIQPREIADLAVYLASNESDGMTAQSISLCGGYIMV